MKLLSLYPCNQKIRALPMPKHISLALEFRVKSTLGTA
jgi:hypothetical protein